jgi:signal transduction histidine kinase
MEAPAPLAKWWRTSPLRIFLEYCGGLLIALAAIGIRLSLDPLFQERFPFITFFIAIAVSAWLFGLGPGFVTGAMCGAGLFLVNPADAFRMDDPGTWLGVAFYVLTSTGISLIIARQNSVQLRLHTALEELKRANDEAENAREGARKAQEAAEQANQGKDQFLSMISHELRNPINSIALSAVALRQGILTPERVTRTVDRIERASRTLAKMVNDLVDSTRVDAGQFSMNPVPVDLVSVIRSAIELIRPAANERNCPYTEDRSPVGHDRVRLGPSFTSDVEPSRQRDRVYAQGRTRRGHSGAYRSRSQSNRCGLRRGNRPSVFAACF